VELPGCLIAPGRVWLEAMPDDRFRPGRDGRVHSPHIRQLLAFREEVRQHLLRRAKGSGKRRSPGQQLAEDKPQAEQVGPLISNRNPRIHSGQLLGGHVA
jgi:hypothetical protein